MYVNRIVILTIGICIVFFAWGCCAGKMSHSDSQETSSTVAVSDTTEAFPMTEATARKLTGPLQRLLRDEMLPIDKLQTHTRDDGQVAYEVLVRVADLDDLRARDLPLGSVQGAIATAHWTREEIYQAAQLDAVQRIEHARTLSPHR